MAMHNHTTCLYLLSQCNVELLSNASVSNPELGMYFQAFKDGCYVPNEYMRTRFPDDDLSLS